MVSLRHLILAFPLIPIIGVFFSILGKYVLKKNCSGYIIPIVSVVQLGIGGMLLYVFHDYEGMYTVDVTPWQYTIVFVFCRYRTYFLAAYMVPLFLYLFRKGVIYKESLRIIFLFFLSGTSGLIITGDVFNFYVFYELMIISAYLIISINNEDYYSVKYMFFGSISSAFFLAGIIVLLASGTYFSITHLHEISHYPAVNVRFLFLFFMTAFLMKGSFFPFYPVALCHTATKPALATFFSSFNIFTGVLGMLFFVLIPAQAIGYDEVFLFLRRVSIITIFTSSLFLFFETKIIRYIAGTTVYSMGFTGLLLSGQHYEAALTYMVIHAVFKSLFFYLGEAIKPGDRPLHLKASPLVYILSLGVMWFVSSLFPTLLFFIKEQFIEDGLILYSLLYISLFLMVAGFLKFHVTFQKEWEGRFIYVLAIVLMGALFILFPFPLQAPITSVLFDYIIVGTALILGKHLFQYFQRFSSFDRRFVFPNLNIELSYAFLLFFIQFVVLEARL